MNVNGGAKGGRVGVEGFLFDFILFHFPLWKVPIALWKQKCGCDEEDMPGKEPIEGKDGKWKSAEAPSDGWTSQGRQRRDKSVEEDSGRFQASVFPSVKTNGIMRGRPRPDGAQWEVRALSYGSAAGMCTGGPSCGNHCSVGRWAGAIRPPASHQLSSAAPSTCVTHLSHHRPSHSSEQPDRWIWAHLPAQPSKRNMFQLKSQKDVASKQLAGAACDTLRSKKRQQINPKKKVCLCLFLAANMNLSFL